MSPLCGKVSYSSRKIAISVAKRTSREKGELIEAYKCKRGCHAWHLGHPIGSRGDYMNVRNTYEQD